MKLLLVEDEKELSGILTRGLRKKGYAVDQAYDGEAALENYEINEYDLIILDLNLPKRDGFSVLSTIRGQDQEIRILILSARNAIEERVKGLDLGANDYLTKPFDFNELDARIRSLLRRAFIQQNQLLTCGTLRMDTAQRRVWSGTGTKHDVEILLTPKELGILEYLLLHQKQVISAETLIEHVWDSDTDLFSNTFKFHIHSLKKKLEEAGCEGTEIRNIRGQGYILRGKE